MEQILLIQLPVPQINFGRRTGNIPLAPAYLHQAAYLHSGIEIEIMPESISSYLGEAALLRWILQRKPDVIGFSTYVWNVDRVRHLSQSLKEIYSPEIIIGGPEVTPDNPLIQPPHIDDRVIGPGEKIFTDRLLRMAPRHSSCTALASDFFERSPSPYLTIPLEHGIEKMMLLETTRGCPYRCAYCYYSKRSKSLSFKSEHHVIEAVSWARDHDIEEIYFLDPSLNARPDLHHMLKKIAHINPDRRITLISEIRAEAVDEKLANLMAAAGFKWLEIGLQSTNPKALKTMRRLTDLNRFARGIEWLKKAGITAGVDLIVGLPGDDLQGFRSTIEFMQRNKLYDDIQVFPLSILPGTEFRHRHRSLEIEFDPTPPYIVTKTDGFTSEQMLTAFEEAERAFDISLYPHPDMDLSWRGVGCSKLDDACDVNVTIHGEKYLYKLLLHPHRSLVELIELAHKTTHPYQILIPPAMTDGAYLKKVIATFTCVNPHTPLEVIFFEPATTPRVDPLIAAAKLTRPHYLDNDLRFADRAPGNRAILFSLVSEKRRSFSGAMQRQVYWWRQERLPQQHDFEELELDGFNGVLIDPGHHLNEKQHKWQDQMAPNSAFLPFVSFGSITLQNRWMKLTSSSEYYLTVLPS